MHHTWRITNNGMVIVIEGTSRTTFDNPGDALVENQRMVRELLVDGHHGLVNRAELTAVSEPLVFDTNEWRGRIEVLLCDTDDLSRHHPIRLA